MDEKILDLDKFAAIRQSLQKDGKKIVHCHGVFDLLHPGHIIHLEEAKKLGDILVVSITSASYVNKGPGRPYFSDELRVKSLAALQCVDFVLLSKAITALEIIDHIKPDFYVKGQEYSDSSNDVTQNIEREAEHVHSWGGEIKYTEGQVFSSTKLLNNHFNVFPTGVKEFTHEFLERYTFDTVRTLVDSMRDLKVLVIGDLIIDEYVMCQIQGLTSKDRAFSGKYIAEERYLGGAFAVADHLSNFSDHVTIFGILGDEPHLHTQVIQKLGNKCHLDLEFDREHHTVVKRRYIERKGVRDQYEKIFSINYLAEGNVSETLRTVMHKKLEKILEKYDLVVVTDYGHGMIDPYIIKMIEEKAKFISLNCQTNSANYGGNLITKYSRANTFVLNETELRLATADRSSDRKSLFPQILDHFKEAQGWLTLGSLGTLCYDGKGEFFEHPALTLDVQDTVGAGDALFALVSLASYLQAPPVVTSLLGNIAGAIAANYLGNSRAVVKEELLKFATTVLKF